MTVRPMISTEVPQMLEAESVSKRYSLGLGTHAEVLTQVSLSAMPGQLTVITGPSGAGKSTLLRLLSGLERASRGTIRISGEDVARLSNASLAMLRRQLGIVLQSEAGLLPRLTPLEHLSDALFARRVPRSERREMAKHWLARLQVDRFADTRVKRLSGGERHRVAIARAFVGSPKCIVADEPTSDLDATLAGLVVDLLIEKRDQGAAIVVATHDERVISRADVVYHLEQGRIADE